MSCETHSYCLNFQNQTIESYCQYTNKNSRFLILVEEEEEKENTYGEPYRSWYVALAPVTYGATHVLRTQGASMRLLYFVLYQKL